MESDTKPSPPSFDKILVTKFDFQSNIKSLLYLIIPVDPK